MNPGQKRKESSNSFFYFYSPRLVVFYENIHFENLHRFHHSNPHFDYHHCTAHIQRHETITYYDYQHIGMYPKFRLYIYLMDSMPFIDAPDAFSLSALLPVIKLGQHKLPLLYETRDLSLPSVNLPSPSADTT